MVHRSGRPPIPVVRVALCVAGALAWSGAPAAGPKDPALTGIGMVHNASGRDLCQLQLVFTTADDDLEPSLESRLPDVPTGASKDMGDFAVFDVEAEPARRYFLVAHDCGDWPIRLVETATLASDARIDVAVGDDGPIDVDASEGAELVTASIHEPTSETAVLEVVNELGTKVCRIEYAKVNGDALDRSEQAAFGREGPFADREHLADGETALLHLRGPGQYRFQGVNCDEDAWLFTGTIDVPKRGQLYLLRPGEDVRTPERDGFEANLVDVSAETPCPEVQFTATMTDALCEAFVTDEWRRACEARTARKANLGEKAPFCGTL